MIGNWFGCDCEGFEKAEDPETSKPGTCPYCKEPLRNPEFFYMMKPVFKGSEQWQIMEEYKEWLKLPGHSRKRMGDFLAERANNAMKEFQDALEGVIAQLARHYPDQHEINNPKKNEEH